MMTIERLCGQLLQYPTLTGGMIKFCLRNLPRNQPSSNGHILLRDHVIKDLKGISGD